MPPLVDPAWLAARLDAPHIQVLDATWFMPGEKRDPAEGFAAARIPGARRFDIDVFSDPDSPWPHMAPSAERFARLMSELGVSDDDDVVFYDRVGIFSAARGWWLMRLFGHDAVSVLNGGLPAWQRDGRWCDSGVPAAPPLEGRFTATLRRERVRDLAEMRANLHARAEIVVDARSAGRFDGSEPEPRPGLPGGHIPESRSLPYTRLLAPDGRMLAPDLLQPQFIDAGLDFSGRPPLVTSCGSGITAAVLNLGLAVAGLPEAALYDGSWTEWASQDNTPKER